MYVDRATGEIRPHYKFGEVILLSSRVNLEGFQTLVDLVYDDLDLYNKHLQPVLCRVLEKRYKRFVRKKTKGGSDV